MLTRKRNKLGEGLLAAQLQLFAKTSGCFLSDSPGTSREMPAWRDAGSPTPPGSAAAACHNGVPTKLVIPVIVGGGVCPHERTAMHEAGAGRKNKTKRPRFLWPTQHFTKAGQIPRSRVTSSHTAAPLTASQKLVRDKRMQYGTIDADVRLFTSVTIDR